jgi:Domain of unknown function (DUF5666)
MYRLARLVAVLLLSACGGGGDGMVGTGSGSSAPPTKPPTSSPAATTAVQINFGDDPSDRLLAVAVTVSSVELTHASGEAVVAMSGPRSMEMLRLMGTVAPLAIANVPHGTYTGASMTFASATVMHVDPVSGLPLQRQISGPMTATVRFSAPLVVATAPMVVNLDMNMRASIGIDVGGNVSMNPTLTAQHGVVVAGGMDHEDGGLHGMMGSVSRMSGGGFALTMMQGLPDVALATHIGTHYDGMGGAHMMSQGQLVAVDAMLQPDGSWLASHVQARMAAGGAMSGGILTGITGSPPTQFTVVMHDGAGTGMMGANLGSATTVTVSDTTVFSIDSTGIDLSGLPFTPRFDRASVAKSQRIEALSSGQMTQGGGMHGMMGGGALAASSIRLGVQGFQGVVSGYTHNDSQSTFTLTVPAESAFAKLTGATSMTVYQRAGTQLRGASSIANGTSVQVRGLLFLDAGAFRFVAGRIRAV